MYYIDYQIALSSYTDLLQKFPVNLYKVVHPTIIKLSFFMFQTQEIFTNKGFIYEDTCTFNFYQIVGLHTELGYLNSQSKILIIFGFMHLTNLIFIIENILNL